MKDTLQLFHHFWSSHNGIELSFCRTDSSQRLEYGFPGNYSTIKEDIISSHGMSLRKTELHGMVGNNRKFRLSAENLL